MSSEEEVGIFEEGVIEAVSLDYSIVYSDVTWIDSYIVMRSYMKTLPRRRYAAVIL